MCTIGDKTQIWDRSGNLVITAEQLIPSEPLHWLLSTAMTPDSKATSIQSNQDYFLWHYHMGHFSHNALHHAPDHVSGIPKLEIPSIPRPCRGCLLGKAHKRPFPPSDSKGDKLLGLVHTDLCEFPVRSRMQHTWMMTFLDDFSGYGSIICLKKKLDADTAFQNWFAWAEKSCGNKLLKLRSDRGGEYMSSALWNFLSENGIEHQKVVPHTPQQNGRAEHFNCTLLDKSEAVQQHACLPPNIWQNAIETSLHIYNRQPMCCLNWYSPIHLWNGTKPDISYFRTFRCQTYVFIPKDRRANKLAPKSEDMIFIGYEPGTKGYCFWSKIRRMVVISLWPHLTSFTFRIVLERSYKTNHCLPKFNLLK